MSEGSDRQLRFGKLTMVGSDDPVLHSVATLIEEGEVRSFVDTAYEMFDLVVDQTGTGLAAPQVGISRRLFVIFYGGRKYFCINPVIIKSMKPMVTASEGCLSYPGVHVPVTRFERIKVEYLDLAGNINRHYMNGWIARIFQHELDHLDGIVFLDRSKEQGANHG